MLPFGFLPPCPLGSGRAGFFIIYLEQYRTFFGLKDDRPLRVGLQLDTRTSVATTRFRFPSSCSGFSFDLAVLAMRRWRPLSAAASADPAPCCIRRVIGEINRHARSD